MVIIGFGGASRTSNYVDSFLKDQLGLSEEGVKMNVFISEINIGSHHRSRDEHSDVPFLMYANVSVSDRGESEVEII